MIPGVCCGNCVFFSAFGPNPRRASQRRGQCRAHGPLLELSDRGPRTLWPLVNESDWCGDHSQPADDAEA